MKRTDKNVEKTYPPIGPRIYVSVWLGLLVLTALTITVARMDLGKISAVGSLFIASCKASLVLYYFMHLKYESLLLKVMLFLALALLTSIIGFTLLDVLYR